MAQVIETYCDGCLERGEKVQARTYRTAIHVVGVKAPTYDIDLCDDCAKPLRVILEGVEEHGRIVAKSGRSKSAPRVLSSSSSASPAKDAPSSASTSGAVDSDTSCPLCPFVSSSVLGLKSHLANVHDTTLSAAKGEPQPFQCDVCQKPLSTPQGAGAHRRNAHPDAPEIESVDVLRVES